jgi:hypothetical protein
VYIEPARRYYRGTEQCAARGRFLLLIQPERGGGRSPTCCASNTYAFVRKVALRQCGHWMMGVANLNGKWVTVSGDYGNDGLPMGALELPKGAVNLPLELYELWSKGGGHNGAGSEAPAMRRWARETFK